MKNISVTIIASIIGWTGIQSVAADPSAKFRQLYYFCQEPSCPDGSWPFAGVIDVEGILYGTTEEGGDASSGTVFALDLKTGAETVLHSFPSQQGDGAFPYAALLNWAGSLYGTTEAGGAQDAGTVFSIDPNTGAEAVLHSFPSQQGDGVFPFANLIAVKGTLFGTTTSGGSGQGAYCGACGTVFSIDPSTGSETVLHSFCSQANCADGGGPTAGLIDSKGLLYGATGYGGNTECSGFGCGTVFSINPNTGSETVLYSFCSQANCADGEAPYGGVIVVKDILYGTTQYGGENDGGVVFSLNLETGAEKVLYSFCSKAGCVDGDGPVAGLTNKKNKLYGTTLQGGSDNQGTVFSIDSNTGTEQVLYSFCGLANCADGSEPYTSLIEVKGTLYGTTFKGGNGSGTVFSLKP